MAVRRTIAITVAILMVLSLAVALVVTQSPEARAALEYNEDYVDWSTRGPRDAGTAVFLRASGNVGMVSEGVGLNHAYYQDHPVEHIDMTVGKPKKPWAPDSAVHNHVPEGAEVQRAFLYWAGDFGTSTTPIPDTDIPEGSDQMYFEGILLSSDNTNTEYSGHDVDYLGYEHMDQINHRRVYRCEVTDILQSGAYGGDYNRKYSVKPTHQAQAVFHPWRAWWGANLVIVFTHESISSANICIADGCNIMDIGGTPDDHITPYTATGFNPDIDLLPSAYKGIVCSEGGQWDVVGYEFQANGTPTPEAFIEDDLEADVICRDSDKDSIDDWTFDIRGNVVPDTTEYSIDMWNIDEFGAYCDLYVDWFWFGAMIDFELAKTAKLVLDADHSGDVSPGDTLKYTLTYRNAGDTGAEQVVLTDDLDMEYIDSVTAISGGGVLDNGVITWDIGELPSGSETYEQTYRVTLKGRDDFAPGDYDLLNTARLEDEETGYFKTAAHEETIHVLAQPLEKIYGYTEWYLAEGSTGFDHRGNFETWVLLQNAGVEDANVTVTYMTPDGAVDGPETPLQAGTRTTVNVANTVPDEWSVSTYVTSDQPVIAERAMYWNTSDGIYRQCAHDSIGVIETSTEWYLAEGSTGFDHRGNFESWVLVQNPGDEAANVQITYMTPEGAVAGPTPTLNPNSRETFNIATNVPDEWSVSTHVTSDEPVIAERAMYWHSSDGIYRQCAHDSIGTTETYTEWYLAEGSTGFDHQGEFETWVLLQNAGNDPANVQITYMTPDGAVAGPTPTLNPNSRETFNVAIHVPDEWSVSTHVTSDQPIIAERAMYWHTTQGIYRQAAHDCIGVVLDGNTWFLAEGSTGSDYRGGFQTWILVQNAGDETANIQITYMTPDGTVEGPTATIGPDTRQTFNVATHVPDEWSVSTMVASDQPVIAERAMYWDTSGGVYRQCAHDSIGLDP